MKDLFRNGYALLGVSAFRGPAQSDGALESQAKKVGADVVLLSCVYLGSEEAAVPWVQYSPGPTYTTTSPYGTFTTTSSGTYSTEVIPITIHRYQYEAGFFRRMQPTILGVLARPLPSEIRQQLERNTGVFAWVVRSGSPAFNANILEGDVILKVNGEDVLSVSDYVEKYTKLAGQNVEVEIWRNGQFKTISVQLNNKSIFQQ